MYLNKNYILENNLKSNTNSKPAYTKFLNREFVEIESYDLFKYIELLANEELIPNLNMSSLPSYCSFKCKVRSTRITFAFENNNGTKKQNIEGPKNEQLIYTFITKDNIIYATDIDERLIICSDECSVMNQILTEENLIAIHRFILMSVYKFNELIDKRAICFNFDKKIKKIAFREFEYEMNYNQKADKDSKGFYHLFVNRFIKNIDTSSSSIFNEKLVLVTHEFEKYWSGIVQIIRHISQTYTTTFYTYLEIDKMKKLEINQENKLSREDLMIKYMYSVLIKGHYYYFIYKEFIFWIQLTDFNVRIQSKSDKEFIELSLFDIVNTDYLKKIGDFLENFYLENKLMVKLNDEVGKWIIHDFIGTFNIFHADSFEYSLDSCIAQKYNCSTLEWINSIIKGLNDGSCEILDSRIHSDWKDKIHYIYHVIRVQEKTVYIFIISYYHFFIFDSIEDAKMYMSSLSLRGERGE